MDGIVEELVPEQLQEEIQHLIEETVVPAAEALPEAMQPLLGTPQGLVMFATSVLIGLLLLYLIFGLGRKKRGSTIVLAGPPNSGKTTLFFQLKDGSLHNGVVASMGENAAAVTLRPARGGPKTAAVLDVPGHHSMRHRLEGALGDAGAVVFLVDAVEVTPHRTEAADMLYEVLTHPVVQRSRVPVLIACNKMDLELEAHSVDFIRKTLEKQLDMMRKTRTAAVGKDAGAKAPALGAPDKPFAFAALPNKVALAEASAKTGRLDEVISFIAASV